MVDIGSSWLRLVVCAPFFANDLNGLIDPLLGPLLVPEVL